MAIDKRHKRRDASRTDLLAALDRLRTGNATHPKHIGIRVRITKEAVAREARKSPATLYRLPDVVDAINSSASANPQEQRVSQSEQRRKALLVQIEDLEKENGLLLSENFRLQRLLAMYDPTLGDNKPIDLAASREQKRLAKGMPPRVI